MLFGAHTDKQEIDIISVQPSKVMLPHSCPLQELLSITFLHTSRRIVSRSSNCKYIIVLSFSITKIQRRQLRSLSSVAKIQDGVTNDEYPTFITWLALVKLETVFTRRDEEKKNFVCCSCYDPFYTTNERIFVLGKTKSENVIKLKALHSDNGGKYTSQ